MPAPDTLLRQDHGISRGTTVFIFIIYLVRRGMLPDKDEFGTGWQHGAAPCGAGLIPDENRCV